MAGYHHRYEHGTGIRYIDTKEAAHEKGRKRRLLAEPKWNGKYVSAENEKQCYGTPAGDRQKVPVRTGEFIKRGMKVNENYRKRCEAPDGIESEYATPGCPLVELLFLRRSVNSPIPL